MSWETYADFFLNTSSSVIQYETFEITHPSFRQGNADGGRTYRIVRNKMDGLHTDDGRDYIYYPAQIRSKGLKDDLDYGYEIVVGDLGVVFPEEMDAVEADGAFNVKPTIVYRTYRQDDTSSVMNGPYVLNIKTFTFKREGVSFDVKAPDANVNQTGEIYTFLRFPALRGFL